MYSREQLNQALSSENPFEIVPSQDEIGHGTFMAGVAAGNENRAEEFSGVAPLSELVVVKCRQANESYRNYYRIPSDVPAYLESDVMTGLAYLLSVAVPVPIATIVSFLQSIWNPVKQKKFLI